MIHEDLNSHLLTLTQLAEESTALTVCPFGQKVRRGGDYLSHSLTIDDTPLTITKGDSILSNKSIILNDPSLSNNLAEEADQKLIRHMLQCVKSGKEQCKVRTIDTDVIISLVAYRHLAKNLECKVFACLTSTSTSTYYDINKISLSLDRVRCCFIFLQPWEVQIFGSLV